MEYETMRYYKGLIEMRKSFDIFPSPAAEIVSAEELGSGILALRYCDGKGGEAAVLINPHNTGLPYVLEGEWNLVATADAAGSSVLGRESGSVTVDAIGIRVYVNDALIQ